MNKIKILNAWGGEGNEFRNPSTANNGGGYSQPYGGLTVQVGDEHLYMKLKIPDVETSENGTSSQFVRLSGKCNGLSILVKWMSKKSAKKYSGDGRKISVPSLAL